MKKKLLALALLAGGSLFAETRFSIGINLGGGPAYYAPPRAYVAARPPCPGPGYVWSDGYWSQGRGPRTWVNGSWIRQRGFRAAPYNGRYDRGYDRHDYDRGRNAYDNGFRHR